MPDAIITNRLKFPPGYFRPAPKYSVFSGALANYGPQAALVGDVTDVATTAAPADLSSITLNGPNGVQYEFQFVYNASVQTRGIKVPLPASGGSTAAQVTAQLLSVLGAKSGVDINGVTFVYPWRAAQTASNIVSLNWTFNGRITSTSSPSGITLTTTAGTRSSNAVVPGSVGFLGALLPGA